MRRLGCACWVEREVWNVGKIDNDVCCVEETDRHVEKSKFE
jgi:hypothetical protein